MPTRNGCTRCIVRPKAVVALDVFELGRFLGKVRRLRSGCWIWLGCRDAAGYGVFRRKTGACWAHRVAYASLVGPIVDGLAVNHQCRRRCCVNPAHLELLSVSENCRDGARARWSSR